MSYNPDFVERVGGGKWNLPRSKLVQQVRDDLFPNTHVLIAYQTLFGMYCGLVPDGVDSLGLDDIEWAGDSTVLLSYFKGRTSRESANLPKRAVRCWSSGWNSPPPCGSSPASSCANRSGSRRIHAQSGD